MSVSTCQGQTDRLRQIATRAEAKHLLLAGNVYTASCFPPHFILQLRFTRRTSFREPINHFVLRGDSSVAIDDSR